MSTATTQIIISGKDQLSSVVADAGRRMGTELQLVQQNVLNLQNAFMGLAGAAALGQIRQSYGQYDAALRDMGTVTEESMGVIAAKIGEVPAELGNATELIQGYYQVISAGITEPAKAMDTLTDSTKAAKAAHVAQAEVIKGVTKVMAGYAGDVKTAADAADLLFTIEKQGQTSFAELIPVIGDVAAISKQLGVEQQEMGAALAAVTLTAGSTSQAATQYRMMLVNLMKPTKEMQAALDAMGASSGKAAIEQFGLAGTLARLQEYATSSGKSVAKLFESSEALLSVAALSRGEFAQYNTNLQAMEQRAGAADKAFQKWKESTQAVDDLFRNTMTNTLIKIGGEIMPMVNDSVRDFAEFVAAHDDEIAGTFGRLAEYGQTIGVAVVPALRDVGSILKDTVLPPVVGIFEASNKLISLVPADYQSSVGAGIIGYALLGPKGAVIAASIAAIDASMNRLTQTTWELMGGTGNYAAVHDQLRAKGREAFEQILSGQIAATGAMHTYRGAVSQAVRGAIALREEGKKTADSLASGPGTGAGGQKKTDTAAQKAYEKMISDGKKAAEVLDQYWDDYESRRVSAIVDGTSARVSAVAVEREAIEELTTWGAYSAQAMEDTVSTAFQGMGDAIVDFAMTGKMEFSDFADSIIRDMMRIVVQQQVVGPLGSAAGNFLSGLFSGPSSAAGTGYAGELSSFMSRSAKGNVFSGPGISAFSNSIVTQPTQFWAKGGHLMGEAGPEAIMPLKRGPDGVLGVRADGGGMVVNIIESPGNGGKTQSRQENGVNILDVMVEQIKSSIASDINRGNGVVPQAITKSYGLSRAPGAY
jgi:lambda family phage tail tape measure protein/TP901 family phage tail tape measure protein